MHVCVCVCVCVCRFDGWASTSVSPNGMERKTSTETGAVYLISKDILKCNRTSRTLGMIKYLLITITTTSTNSGSTC